MKIGDVVQLKTGGPRMTVEHVSDVTGFVRCVWFVERSTGWDGPYRSVFDRDHLQRIDP